MEGAERRIISKHCYETNRESKKWRYRIFWHFTHRHFMSPSDSPIRIWDLNKQTAAYQNAMRMNVNTMCVLSSLTIDHTYIVNHRIGDVSYATFAKIRNIIVYYVETTLQSQSLIGVLIVRE